MTQFTKTSPGRKLRKKPPSSEAADTEQKGRKQRLIIASLIIAVIAVVVGVGYYLIYVAPFQQTIIVVNDVSSINMRYFLKRTYMASKDPQLMLENLTQELIIKQVVPQPPYNIKVTAEDIDQALREIARRESETISDSEFREWYRQQLNQTGLSDAEYRDLTYTNLLKARLYMYLAEREPTETMHFYLHAIFLDSPQDAETVRARWEAGEDFADLAREVSTDEVSAEHGGDIGWFPRKTLGDTFREALLGLDVGEVSQPVPIVQWETEEVTVTYALIMVSDKAVREMDEDALAIVYSKAFEEWLLNQRQFHKVSVYGRDGAGNWGSKTISWINWQLQEMAR